MTLVDSTWDLEIRTIGAITSYRMICRHTGWFVKATGWFATKHAAVEELYLHFSGVADLAIIPNPGPAGTGSSEA